MVEHTPQIQSTQRKPISLVFVGETGAGKTTLLHALSDYIEGKSF
jgi:type IV secretory pathway ATPase VirB11/archaellum biosynthesis ATPase